MDNNEKFTFWVVAIGVLILIGCFAYIIVRNIKQKKKREAFSQNYNIDLPKNCLLDTRGGGRWDHQHIDPGLSLCGWSTNQLQ